MTRATTARYVDIALNRPAFQSSLSEWSHENDAQRALSGKSLGSFAFHTDTESAPFWYVDLQSTYLVRRIVISNRQDCCAERAVPLHVEVSISGEDWTLLASVHYIFGDRLNGGPFTLSLREGHEARFVRLRRTGEKPAPLHLGQIQIFTGTDDLPLSAQLRQDAWVLQMTAARHGGTFIDIGATNGVDINNTYLLEARFGWTGVCAEPNPEYYSALVRNRKAMCLQRAVWREDGVKREFLPCAEFGTLVGFEASDMHAHTRRELMKETEGITVETISPNELLRLSELPTIIDYLSIDTEGSEWEILRNFDLFSVRFGLITIEHNYDDHRRRLVSDFLGAYGYLRVPVQWDDWYYHPFHLRELNNSADVDFGEVSRLFADEDDRDFSQRSGQRPGAFEATIPIAIDDEARTLMAGRCRDADCVPKVPGAGDVLDGGTIQRMHNGVLVPASAYYGDWMTRLITLCRGHHEPQEERLFHEVVSRLPATATMIELGSYWAYYTAWFLKDAPLRRAVMLEPDPIHRAVGERTLALNRLEATMLAGFIGRTAAPALPFRTDRSGTILLPRMTVPELMESRGMAMLDLLHCDTQGAELDVLVSCRDLLREGRIGWLFISTHAHQATGDPLTHQRCLALLQELGATIEAEHDVHESFSGDGLIVARFVPAPPGWTPVSLSYNRSSTSLFRNPVYDLAVLLAEAQNARL